MTREELRDYVDEQRALNNIPYHVYSALIDGIDTLEQEPCKKTQMVDKSNFSLEQYRTDLQSAFDCGKASVECEDCISRQAVLIYIEFILTHGMGEKKSFEFIKKYVEKQHSVTPKQKMGHWIKDDITERSKSAYKHKCDRCGAYHRAMYDYCPSCGAKMEESEG